VKKIKFILLLPILFVVQGIAENNSTRYMESNRTISYNNSFVNIDLNESFSREKNITKCYPMMNRVPTPSRKTLLEVEVEARAIIAEEVAKVEIVKANALAVIARAVASVEIAKIREEQEKESSSDLF
jgi:hypothetical protein